MPLKRTKRSDIYDVVGQFYQGGVPYTAHAILTDGTAILLHAAVEGTGNQNLATNHPDQAFWKDNGTAICAKIGTKAASIKRIEVDCALLPCTGQGGCLIRVPALIRGLYKDGRLDDVALRIFSHRSEFSAQNLPAGDKSDHRYIDTRTAANHDQQAAYNAHRGWGWVTTGFTNLQYANDHQAIVG